MCKRGQGATEYLLMLAAVLIIVAIAVYYVTSSGGGAIISYSAENVGDTCVLTFRTGTSTVTGAWDFCIVTAAGVQSAWSTTQTADITAGTVIIENAVTADSGDTFRLRVSSSSYDATIA